MESDKDTFHVVIKLPFPRPNDFAEPPSIVWTEEMEHQLWKHMSQKSKDWNAIAEQLGIPTQYVVRHAAFIYETQLRGIQQQLRLNVGRTKSPVVNKSRPPSIRYSDTIQHNELPQENRQTSDSLLLSKISTIAPRLQESENQDSSLIEEKPIENQEEIEEDDQDITDQLEKVQIEEEPAFLPRRSTSKTISNSSRLSLSIQNLKKTITPQQQQQQQQQQQLPQSPQIVTASSSNNPSALNSVGSSFSDLSDSSVTQSALEDAFMSKFNQGSKM
ncbi:hypothetical protein RMATCC62417_16725 [Rhizopus microsporus]|nr:hypothetical protein RMATCC62417_16725 [Rhizopus microsporus]